MLVLILCFIMFSLFNIFLIYFDQSPFFLSSTGRGITGTVSLYIEGGANVYIHTPKNITYNFSIGDPYLLELNVSSDFDAADWKYTLYDLTHDEIESEDVPFTPNTTFVAVRWSNNLTVYAREEGGNWHSASVVFYVYVPNSAPSIGEIDSDIYVCEGDYLSYHFNATDVDEDDMTSDISPKNPFYVFPVLWYANGMTYTVFEIISGTLSKTHAGGINQGYKVYEETVSVSDGEYVDYNYTNITVIEINNAPVVTAVGVQTVYTRGDNSTFYKQVQVSDTEDGDQDSGNLGFNITIWNSTGTVVDLFNISQNGTMNFTANENYVGVYDISVCVNDTGIENPFEGILGNCSQDGSLESVCQNFSLTVTNENRAPTITDYYPTNLSLNVFGTDSLYFNITEYDPDGTFPDAYWYVDDVFKEYDSGSLVDEFSYSFGCGVSENFVIKAEITDGLLNDSVEWSLNVSYVVCPPGAVPSRGGGGGGFVGCFPKWSCNDWKICQNAEKSLEIGLLSGEDYRIIQEQCLEDNLDEEACGFQMRDCFDLNNCNTSIHKPVGVQFCHYVEKPSCYDGVKNCHHDACEILVDCGGPCPPCPSCSDGIQNQGEERVDCGGPCPICVEVPREIFLVNLILIILALILSIAIIIILIKIVKVKKKIKK